MGPKKKINEDAAPVEASPAKKPRTKKARAETEKDTAEAPAASGEAEPLTKKQKAAISAEKNGPHIRDIIVPKPYSEGHKFLKVISWNVNGFKALAANNLTVLTNLIANHKPDILCLQETKLQTTQVDDFRGILEGYESHWSCSTDKKGYSGTAVFINKATIATTGGETAAGAPAPPPPPKKKQATLGAFFKKTTPDTTTAAPTESAVAAAAPKATSPAGAPVAQLVRVSFDFEDEKKCFSGEGRTITVELDSLIVLAAYVPNSGEGLVRLDYRTKEWDPWVRNYVNKLSQRKPVVFTGDLNVGYLDLDIHNPTAKHISQQAGLTPQERESHGELLSTNFVDAFRVFYPEARGQFTYWSQRTFARPVNKGIRLDYFICSRNMFKPSHITASQAACTENGNGAASEGGSGNVPARRVDASIGDIPSPGAYDSYMLPEDTKGCSDHGPVVLVVKL